jgi:hypothetical protein
MDGERELYVRVCGCRERKPLADRSLFGALTFLNV